MADNSVLLCLLVLRLHSMYLFVLCNLNHLDSSTSFYVSSLLLISALVSSIRSILSIGTYTTRLHPDVTSKIIHN